MICAENVTELGIDPSRLSEGESAYPYAMHHAPMSHGAIELWVEYLMNVAVPPLDDASFLGVLVILAVT